MDQVIKNLRERKEAHGAKCVEIAGILRRNKEQHEKLATDLDYLLNRWPEYRNARESSFYERQRERED